MSRASMPPLVRAAARSEGAESCREDERTLARALIARRADAVVPAWRLLCPYVERTLQCLLGPDRDREDLVQEVFLRFFRKVPALRDPNALRPFVFGIAARVVKRHLRRRWLGRWLSLAGGRALEAAEETVEAPSGAEPLAREAVERLHRVLDAVGAEDRSLFVARYVEEMELADVAAAHGLSFSTARRRLDRAWSRVRARAARDPILGSYLEGGGEQ